MGFLDSLKTWFRSESAEAKDVIGGTRSRLESDLDRRQAELSATPAERMDKLQDQISDGDQSFEDLRDKIEGRTAKADAVEELTSDEEPPSDDDDGGADAGPAAEV